MSAMTEGIKRGARKAASVAKKEGKSELEKFIARHGPGIKESAGELGGRVKDAGSDALERGGKFAVKHSGEIVKGAVGGAAAGLTGGALAKMMSHEEEDPDEVHFKRRKKDAAAD